MDHRVDLHIHTCYSRADGLMSPRAVVRLARRLRYSAIAVTDHYTYDGAVRGTFAAQRLAAEEGIRAYPGLEYHVTSGPERGHLLLYVEHPDQVPPRGLSLDPLLDHARDEGLTVIHPHPFGFAGIRSLALMRRADHVELNGSYGDGLPNRRLLDLARVMELENKLVGNSDAHARGQMGSAYTTVEEVHDALADTLATRVGVGLAAPRRSWGGAAKMVRIGTAPIGMLVNGVQKVATARALARLPGADAPVRA